MAKRKVDRHVSTPQITNPALLIAELKKYSLADWGTNRMVPKNTAARPEKVPYKMYAPEKHSEARANKTTIGVASTLNTVNSV